MTATRRVLLVVVAVIALAAGYGMSRLVYGSERRPIDPGIDLDNLPPAEVPPSTVAPGDGATIIPPPTLAPAPAPTSPPPAPTSAPPPTGPPQTPPDHDDGRGDAGDDDDAGELGG